MFSFILGAAACYAMAGIYVAALNRESLLAWKDPGANWKQVARDIATWPITVRKQFI